MPRITVGAGRRRTRGESIELADVGELIWLLTNLPAEEDSWWSGHLWRDDNRCKPLQWLACEVVIIDVDYYSSVGQTNKERRCAPGVSARELIDTSPPPCSLWHHTPRGLRVAFVPDAPIAEISTYSDTWLGCSALITDWLDDLGLLASVDGKGSPRGGYHVDSAANDLAHFMFAPNAIVDGIARQDRVVDGDVASWPVDLLVDVARNTTAHTLDDIGDILARMPCEGEKDGSAELIRVAARAIRLGVESSDRFVRVVSCWNSQRGTPWSVEDLTTRFEDSLRRWQSEGRVVIPTNDKGNPIYSIAILDKILRGDSRYKDRLSYNDLEMTVCHSGLAGLVPVLDEQLYTIRVDITRAYGFSRVPKDDITDSVRSISLERSFNPVVEYLERLVWDKVDRLGQLADALFVGDEALNRVYLQKWFISAIARAYQPGCKVDTSLVIVGPQGYFKSTFFRVLGGDWFSDTFVDFGDKDGLLQLLGVWIYELSELESIYRKADVARVRGIQASSVDRFRAPYERVPRKHPRKVVLVGTSNSFSVLRDEDGTRRFWVVEVLRPIDPVAVAGLRDQLWAEGVARYKAGETWYLDASQDLRRAEVNARFEPERTEVTGWLEVIREAAKGKSYLTANDIAKRAGYSPLTLSPGLQHSMGKAFDMLGWQRSRRRVDGQRVRVYEKPTDWLEGERSAATSERTGNVFAIRG